MYKKLLFFTLCVVYASIACALQGVEYESANPWIVVGRAYVDIVKHLDMQNYDGYSAQKSQQDYVLTCVKDKLAFVHGEAFLDGWSDSRIRAAARYIWQTEELQ